MADAISRLFSNGEAGVWYDPSDAAGGLTWQRNLLEYTESFDNSYWTPTRGSISAASITDPTGGTGAYSWTATEFTETYIDRRQGINKTVGSTVTLSCFIKKETADYCHLLLWDTQANGARCWFNLVNGSVGSNTFFGSTYTFNDASVTDAGNGWYRCVLTVNASAGSSVVGRFSPSNGDGDVNSSAGKSIYLWGAQLEEASTASSYQPILSTFESAFKAANPNHTLYQDYQGVTPVTAVGEPVGLMLDKSEGLAQGPELVTNGDFATDSDWGKGAGWTISGGQAVGASANSNLTQSISVSNGSLYKAKFTISSYTSGSINRVQLGGVLGSTLSASAVGEYESLIIANNTGNSTLYVVGTNFVGSIDNVSVTEIQGSHATQPTSTKRPIYARHPEGGIRNLLNYTEQFDNGAWIKTSMSVVANQTTAPDGTQTADKFTPVGGGIHLFGLNQSIGAGNNTASVYMKKGTGRYGGIRLVNDAFGNDRYSVLIDLETGSFVSDYSTGNPPVKAYKIDDSGNGWYRLSVMLQHSTSTMNVSVFTNNDNTPAWATTALPEYTANGTDYIYAWGAQLEEATEASNYQKVVTDIDVTESGVGEVYYLKFDGVDDGMLINNLTSSSTPLTALFGYSATNADATRAKLLIDIQTGRTIFGASADSANHIGYFDGAWSQFSADSNAIKVLTYDLVENDAKIRIDGTQEYSDTTYDQQAISGAIGLFQNYVGSVNTIAGNMYQTILRAAESTDEEIAKAETYVANKTGLKAQVDGIATLDLNFGANTYTAKNSNGGVI